MSMRISNIRSELKELYSENERLKQRSIYNSINLDNLSNRMRQLVGKRMPYISTSVYQPVIGHLSTYVFELVGNLSETMQLEKYKYFKKFEQ